MPADKLNYPSKVDDYKKLTGTLVKSAFTHDELLSSTVTGKGSNASVERRVFNKLDSTKVAAIKGNS